jgi:hypothetical protein
MEHSIHSETHPEHSIPQKSDVDTIELQQNEKAITESPVESVEPIAEHVTAKTWLVIFVSPPDIQFHSKTYQNQILSSTFGLSFWPVPTTAAMQAGLGIKFGNPTSTYWMSMFSDHSIIYESLINMMKFLLTRPRMRLE